MENNLPLVSVIVPVYNTEKYLNQCVDSIINQTYKNLEIILVDDGSTDNSGTICDEYSKRDNRIKVVHQKNSGSAFSRKTGIDNSNGDLYFFIDSDDWIDIDLVSSCLEIFSKGNVDCVLYSYTKEHEKNSIPISLLSGSQKIDSNFLIRRIIGEVGDELNNPEKLDVFASVWTKMYKKDIMVKGVYFDTKYVGSCEDGLFNIYALKETNTCYYLDKPMYHYRKHSRETLTSTYRPRFFEQWNNLWTEFEKFIILNSLDKEYKIALNNRIALSMLGLGLNELLNPNKKQIKRNLKKYLRDAKIKNALNDFKYKSLPLKWQPFMFFCKHKLVSFLHLMLKIMQKMGRTR